MTLQVFDKPMCCSTGVCGPQVDETLVQFAADLDWLRRKGVQVERYNLSQQPREFVQQPDVCAALQDKGAEALPIIRVDGRIVCQGTYPGRELLAAWTHVARTPEAELPVAAAGCCRPERGCC
jgi:hypothetical protein